MDSFMHSLTLRERLKIKYGDLDDSYSLILIKKANPTKSNSNVRSFSQNVVEEQPELA